jgi:UDPglucose 6-dehydrogenase
MIILGGDFLICTEVKKIYECHSHIKMTKFFITSAMEASLVKYTINTFLATKVTFFNQIYKYYIELNEGKEPHYELWNAFTEMVGADYRMGNSHMTVPGPDGQYGYGGNCFPKDVRAFIGSDSNGHLSVLREVELSNTKNRSTGRSNLNNNN